MNKATRYSMEVEEELLRFIKDQWRLPTDIINMIRDYIVCPHAYQCHLKTRRCCWCGDKRGDVITKYIDGIGIVSSDNIPTGIIPFNKNEYYCIGCRIGKGKKK